MNILKVEDNLIFMKSIETCSIDLIYIDILFGTGNKFPDYEDPKFNNYLEIENFYEPRYLQMKRILKESGLLYVHCDCSISHYTKILLDKVFDIKNFRNEIIWHYNSAPRKKKDFGKRHDTIFRYSKSENYFSNENSIYIRQPYSDTAPRGYEKEKYYDSRGKILDDVWKIPMIGQNDKKERVGYSTQKPLNLLYPIIDSSCPIDGIVADFFLGSGTTVVASQNLNRNYIGCDINPKSIEITKKRLGLLA